MRVKPPPASLNGPLNSTQTKLGTLLTNDFDASRCSRNLTNGEQELDFEDDKRGLLRILDSLYGRMFRCPRGKHKRSSSHIRKAGSQYTSRCRSCRKPMVRIVKRNWMLDDRRA